MDKRIFFQIKTGEVDKNGDMLSPEVIEGIVKSIEDGTLGIAPTFSHDGRVVSVSVVPTEKLARNIPNVRSIT